MKYLCLVYANEQELHSSPDSPHDSECHAYAQRVQESGRMLAAEALQSVQTATTVRMRGGKLAITDGPFAETKEQLLGFYVIDVPDLDAALAVAKELSAANPTSCYEIRPVALYVPEQRLGAPTGMVKNY